MNVADFRTNLKDCLDRAVQGETIHIERMGQKFMLIADARTKPLADNEIITEDGARAIVIPKKSGADAPVKLAGHISTKDPDERKYEYCKHGNLKGFCKMGCK